MWKLSRTRAWVAALTVAGTFAAVPASISLACDDDYPAPAGWGQYPAPQPSVVVVEPGYREDRGDHWRRERAARRYWYWRGREHEHAREHWRHERRWD